MSEPWSWADLLEPTGEDSSKGPESPGHLSGGEPRRTGGQVAPSLEEECGPSQGRIEAGGCDADVSAIPRAVPEPFGVVLDDLGFSCGPCVTCGGRLFRAPASAPAEFGMWRCSGCEPPGTVPHHACALPAGEAP